MCQSKNNEETGEMVQSATCSLGMCEVLSLTPITHGKFLGMEVCTCNCKTLEAEKGTLPVFAGQPVYLTRLRSMNGPVSKKQGCINYFFIILINHHNLGNIQKKVYLGL